MLLPCLLAPPLPSSPYGLLQPGSMVTAGVGGLPLLLELLQEAQGNLALTVGRGLPQHTHFHTGQGWGQGSLRSLVTPVQDRGCGRVWGGSPPLPQLALLSRNGQACYRR